MVKYILDTTACVALIRGNKTVPIFPSLRTYGETKSQLEAKGMRIDEFDLLIGATAVDNSMTLVTHNTKHFQRIPNLKLEDWE